MTEEEAKTKWCPMVRFHNGLDGDVYCSRPTGKATDNSAKCIASNCMMWTQTMIIRSDDDGNSYFSIKDGRCGLAK